MQEEIKTIKQVKNSELSGAHGGDIISASARYGIAQEQWLDLSTGLNSISYPTDSLPASAFRQLPYLQPEFLRATAEYYGSEQFIPLIGSQMLIQALPKMLPEKPVLLPDVGYSEHRDSWGAAGFAIQYYPALEHDACLASIDRELQTNSAQHLVVIKPNNPSGVLIAPQQLLCWAAKLEGGCYLIVDEAFIDLTPQLSVLAHQWPANMLVLRSFGKFFGLAGIRLGFAFAQGELQTKITAQLGLWMFNGPAQSIATQAFRDVAWQSMARAQIVADARGTVQLFAALIEHLRELSQSVVTCQVDSGLFISYKMQHSLALKVQQAFCSEGVLLRVIEIPESVDRTELALLRFGLLAVKKGDQQQRITNCIAAFIATYEKQ